jgi:hypothetical protein
MGIVFFLALIGLVIWVGWDASRLGVRKGCRGGGFLDMGVVAWICCCLIFWLVGLIAYVIARPKYVSLRRQFPVGDLPDLRGAGHWGPAASWPGPPAYGVPQGWGPPANPYAAQGWAQPSNPYAAPQSWAQPSNPYAAPQPPATAQPWQQANPYAPPTAQSPTPPAYPAASGYAVPASEVARPHFGGRTCPSCGATDSGYVCARCGTQTV